MSALDDVGGWLSQNAGNVAQVAVGTGLTIAGNPQGLQEVAAGATGIVNNATKSGPGGTGPAPAPLYSSSIWQAFTKQPLGYLDFLKTLATAENQAATSTTADNSHGVAGTTGFEQGLGTLLGNVNKAGVINTVTGIPAVAKAFQQSPGYQALQAQVVAQTTALQQATQQIKNGGVISAQTQAALQSSGEIAQAQGAQAVGLTIVEAESAANAKTQAITTSAQQTAAKITAALAGRPPPATTAPTGGGVAGVVSSAAAGSKAVGGVGGIVTAAAQKPPTGPTLGQVAGVNVKTVTTGNANQAAQALTSALFSHF